MYSDNIYIYKTVRNLKSLFQDFLTYPPQIRTLRTLLTLLIPPPEGGGEVFFGDTPGGPFPHGLEALLGQDHACQLLLDGREQETVSADALAW